MTYDDIWFQICGGQRGIGAKRFSETSLRMHQDTRSHIKQHVNLHISLQKNLKFHTVILRGNDFKQGTYDRNHGKNNFSNTLVLVYLNIRRNVREESNYHSHRSRNVRSQVTLFFKALS